MRGLILGAAALCGVAFQPALAQQRCVTQAEQPAFEIQALRSEMMVLATGCRDAQRYNAVMGKFQADLLANEREISGWFKKKYGRSGQTEHDRFVTDLANARSRQGTHLGSDFCARNGLIFAEVMSLRNSSELANYAAAKDLVPASIIEICRDTPRAQTVAASTTTPPARKPAVKTVKR